ncbi:MAG TPA: 2-isopropylmalate synthase [Myxococcota bacterium]|nr:2-isopropylmalate synthase [Myxococcota bacterium]
MSPMQASKYRPFPPIALPDRTWPERVIDAPPQWCSVDLRDGNQALVEPMGPERKLRMWEQLLAIGFREIEVGFPSASQTDFDFVRQLVEERRVPREVTIQVLTQAREDLIRRTFESIRGARRAIVHLYNSTSALQRRVVFGLDRAGIVEIAVRGAELVRALCRTVPDTDVVLEYSPESFTGTELDFAVEICEAVLAVWEPTPERRVILNLPATVEMATPNVYADQIEWFGRHLRGRDSVVLSVHPHNDRGTAVAAAELAVMAGAERVEGTLFGNGERTGNVDLVTLALNLYTQGVDPGLALDDIDAVRAVVEHCNRLPVHPRHPYAGELVHTAFSGSHQDAIKKGFAALRETGPTPGLAWEVPYLPIDPADVGRSYEAVIRINSQSGKGGVAWVLEVDHGLRLPRRMQIEFSRAVQAVADAGEEEIGSEQLGSLFEREYLGEGTLALVGHRVAPEAGDGRVRVEATVRCQGALRRIAGEGAGPIDAFVAALRKELGVDVHVADYAEHALGEGEDALAAAYVELRRPDGGTTWGAARHRSIVAAGLEAVVSAANRIAGGIAGRSETAPTARRRQPGAGVP